MNYSSETADAVIKNHLFYKIKTDLASSNNSTINPQNEVYNYTRIVRPNEIWKDNPVNYSVSFTQISMTDINPNIQNLKKRSWKLPDLNCPVVPHTYGATFIPIFQYSTNYTNINAITTPYTFDYFTGILTFLSNLPSFGTNDLVYCSGYTYTGSNLTTISGLLFSPGNNNIGISSSIPSQKLDVTGNIYVSSNIFTNSNITTINGNYLVGSTVIVDNNRNFSNVNNLYCPTGNIIGNIATLNQPFVTSMPVLNTIGNLSTTTVGIGSTNQILTFNGSTINLNPLSSGCVAIGKATATQLLDVAGNINSSSNLTVSNNITGSGNIITSGNY
ncbi:hypothetical protein EBV26_20675, partial [bacterium]|nr:hypothetical protein [bacterium]